VFATSGYATKSNEELLLSVKLNGEDLHRIVSFIQTPDGQLWVDKNEVKLWNMKLPEAKPLTYQNHEFYPLSSFQNIQYQINRQNLSIAIEATPSLFIGKQIEGYQFTKNMPQTPSLGGFVNYDFNDQSTPGNQQLNALLEAGVFNQYGVLTNTELAEVAGSEHKKIRLSTTWTKDMPDTMQTLRVGDAFTNPGMWGQSVGYGGLQWGTNFATQPYFIPFPLPQMHGVAAIPSSVDLYVNNALVSKTNIPSGPFSINNIPTITGEGNVNVVVTDILGRQQIINLPSYGSNALLKPHLTSNSYELGFVRNNFGIQSNDYSQLFFATTQRLGVTDTFTHEWRTELSQSLQTLGDGETLLINNAYLVNVSAALSHDAGMGALGLLSLQHLSITRMTYGMNLQVTSRKFVRLGLPSGTYMPSVQSQWFIGFPYKETAYNLGFTQQINRGQPSTRFITFTANKIIAHSWAINLTGLTNIGGPSNKSIFLTLTHALDERRTMSTGFVAQTQASQAQFQLQRSLPTDTGYGYNLNFDQGSQLSYLNTLSAQSSVGNYYVTAARQHAQTGYQWDASGAVSLLENHLYFSRSLTNSFGVVSLPGYQNVDVYLNNQIIGKTNNSGNVFIPALIPYNKNVVSIKPTDLPLNAVIENTELDVIPYYRSGVVIHFPVYPAADGMVEIVLPSGQSVPAGALVQLSGNDKVFPVGENGIAYLSGLKPQNHLRADWGNSHCEFDLTYKISAEPIPNLGTYICK
jgi:outer membrane usher protein